MALTFDPSLSIFDGLQIDSSVDSELNVYVKPLTAVNNDGPYVFQIEPTPNFINLGMVHLQVQCKITRGDGTAIVATEKIGPANNILHSLFSKVETKLGDTVISHSNAMYPYRSYFEDVLMTDSDETNHRLALQGFIMDSATKMAVNDPEHAHKNVGLAKRRNLFALSHERLLIGRLHDDIFRQNRYLPDRVPIRVTLNRSPDAFCLIGQAIAAVAAAHPNPAVAAVPLDHKVVITDMSLMVPMVKVSDAMRRGLETLMNGMPTRYPMTKTVMQSHLIPAATTSFSVPSLMRGNLPHTVILAMVKNEERRADYEKNPFNMEEFDVNKIVLYRNNEPVNYNNGLRMEFTGGGSKDAAAYLNCMVNLGRLEKGLKFTHHDFRAGYAFFPFRVAPQRGPGVNTSVLNHGVLSVEMGFTTATPVNVDLIVLAQYNSEFTVDSDRNVRLVDA